MRKILKILIVGLITCKSFVGFSQEVTSFYFSEPQPSSFSQIDEFDSTHFGVYRLEGQKHTKLIIKKDSIIVRSLIAFEITMDEVNANDSYYIKDGLLYGIAPVGLYFREDDGTLLVALNQSELFCSPKENNIKRDGNTYYINNKTKEGRWRTLVLDVDNEQLAIFDLDHDLSMKQVEKMSPLKEHDEDMMVYIATPTDKQFFSLCKSKGYQSEPVIYNKD